VFATEVSRPREQFVLDGDGNGAAAQLRIEIA